MLPYLSARAVAHGAFLAPDRHDVQQPIVMTGYADGVIVCTAERGAFTLDTFTQALKARFPNTAIQTNHIVNPAHWRAGVQIGDPRQAITVEEAQRWTALFDPDDDPEPAAAPPPAICEVCTCTRPATHAMRFDTGLEGHEYYCDLHAAAFQNDPNIFIVEDVALAAACA